MATRDAQPAWTCTPWGLPCLRASLPERWALTSPFHHHHAIGVAVCFLWHWLSSVKETFLLGSTVLVGVRTFLIPTSREAIVRKSSPYIYMVTTLIVAINV